MFAFRSFDFPTNQTTLANRVRRAAAVLGIEPNLQAGRLSVQYEPPKRYRFGNQFQTTLPTVTVMPSFRVIACYFAQLVSRQLAEATIAPRYQDKTGSSHLNPHPG
jgi:hypothetical protein